MYPIYILHNVFVVSLYPEMGKLDDRVMYQSRGKSGLHRARMPDNVWRR